MPNVRYQPDVDPTEEVKLEVLNAFESHAFVPAARYDRRSLTIEWGTKQIAGSFIVTHDHHVVIQQDEDDYLWTITEFKQLTEKVWERELIAPFSPDICVVLNDHCSFFTDSSNKKRRNTET